MAYANACISLLGGWVQIMRFCLSRSLPILFMFIQILAAAANYKRWTTFCHQSCKLQGCGCIWDLFAFHQIPLGNPGFVLLCNQIAILACKRIMIAKSLHCGIALSACNQISQLTVNLGSTWLQSTPTSLCGDNEWSERAKEKNCTFKGAAGESRKSSARNESSNEIDIPVSLTCYLSFISLLHAFFRKSGWVYPYILIIN